ncbi:MAG: hypothetical protein HUK20_04250 [Fibrobacter sp.]|nr:hypothetical protein [Fibrobacter sp.]
MRSLVLKLTSVLALALVVLLLGACYDSLDYYYDESDVDKEFLSIRAYMTESFEHQGVKLRGDTILVGDSMIYTCDIYPSKATYIRNYFWTLDGNRVSNDFSFRTDIQKAGVHNMVFVVVDNLGDTLSDTLHVTVTSVPELNAKQFIPSNNMQNVSPSDFFSFSWKAKNPDGKGKLFHHFVLQKIGDTSRTILVDEILENPYYTYTQGFEPVSKYEWNVSTFNQYGLQADSQIEGVFYTGGYNKESGIFGSVCPKFSDGQIRTRVTLLDDAENVVWEKELTKTEVADFTIRPVEAGKYLLWVMALDADDYSYDSLEVEVNENEIVQLDTIYLKDRTPPKITSLAGSDTLARTDTLAFLIKDGSGSIQEDRLNIFWNSESVETYDFRNDTLYLLTTDVPGAWVYQVLTIEAVDKSMNTATKSFYVLPNISLEDVW